MAEIEQSHKAAGVQNAQQSFHHSGVSAGVDNRALQLSGTLQSTLELGEVLTLFHAQSAALIPHDGLSYLNKEADYALELGAAAAHRCSYQLLLLDENIGELVFARRTKFTDSEISRLESLIAALIYPLRNALLYKQAVERAHRDTVTGVGNRAAMDNALEQELDLALRHGTTLSAMMLDIDHFKQINDSYGHAAGDTVLRRVADSMVECVRRSDIIYRYGGEEFVILLRNTRALGASLLAERIRQSVEAAHFRYEDYTIQVTISAGLSSIRQDDTAKSLLDRCDQALYQAKEGGRNRIAVAAG